MLRLKYVSDQLFLPTYYHKKRRWNQEFFIGTESMSWNEN